MVRRSTATREPTESSTHRDAVFCGRCGTRRIGKFRFCLGCRFDFEPFHGARSDVSAALVSDTILAPALVSASIPIPVGADEIHPGSIPIAEGRRLPEGSELTISGVLTVALGSIDAGRGGFIQDISGAVALRLDHPATGVWPVGSTLTVTGTTADRFGQRTLRVTEGSIQRGPVGPLPSAIVTTAGFVAEPLEGMRVRITGLVRGRPTKLADGLGMVIEDASGSIRAVVGSGVLGERKVADGMPISLAGSVGKRTDTRQGSSGYRIHVTGADDVQLGAAAAAAPWVGRETGPAPHPVTAAAPWVGRETGPAPHPVTAAAPWVIERPPPQSSVSANDSPTKDEPARPRVDRRPLNRNVARLIMLASLIAAFALASGDPMKFAGFLGGFTILAVLTYREVRWLDVD
jgi:hypothetical protein